MSKRICLAALSVDDASTAFLRSLLERKDDFAWPFLLVTIPGHPVLEIARSRIPCHILESVPADQDSSNRLLAQFLEQNGKKTPVALVHAFDPLSHAAAAHWRSQKDSGCFVIQTRYNADPVPDSRANYQLHNVLTDATLFPDHATHSAFRAKEKESGLFIRTAVVLDQARFGPEPALKMLAWCYAALLAPTRSSAASRPVRSFSHLKLSYITHFYCNQDNTSSVMSLLRQYAAYSPEVLDRVHFVIVDDGSPVTYEIPDLPLNLTWLKITEDIPWNNPGARNLGAVYAKSDNLLITDLDHEFPEEALRRIIPRPPCGKCFYKLWREKRDTGQLYKAHSNVFFLSRGRMLEFNGYDEEFCGNYAYDDLRFVKFQRANGSFQRYLPKSIRCRERPVDREKAYHSLARDLSFNAVIDHRKRMEIAQFGERQGHSRMFLNFKWEVLAERWRDPAPQPEINRWWKRFARLREIMPRFYS